MSGRIESRLARRRFLKGAGGAAIALPLFWGRERTAHAAATAPERFISVYFGNGLPPDLTSGGYAAKPFGGIGPLEPLVPFQSKLTMVRGINGVAKDDGATGHMPGSGTFCVAQDVVDNAFSAGGPSLDWVLYQHFKGLAPQQKLTPLDIVSAGVYGQSGSKPETVRWTHSWKGAGKANAIEPFHDPLALFNKLFPGGASPPPGGMPAKPQGLARYRGSVLDAVMAEYKQLTGSASPYPVGLRSQLSNHFDMIRKLEQQAMDINNQMMNGTMCRVTPAPAKMDSKDKEDLNYWATVWPVMMDIYILGLQCDLFRFGNVLTTMGGEAYTVNTGSDSTNNCHGNWYHSYPNKQAQVSFIVNKQMQMIAQFLDKMSKTPDPYEAGKNMLDSTTLLIGTELSTPQDHSRKGMTFFMAGAKGRFAGGIKDVGGRNDTDLYNTIFTKMTGNMPATTFGKGGTFAGALTI